MNAEGRTIMFGGLATPADLAVLRDRESRLMHQLADFQAGGERAGVARTHRALIHVAGVLRLYGTPESAD